MCSCTASDLGRHLNRQPIKIHLANTIMVFEVRQIIFSKIDFNNKRTFKTVANEIITCRSCRALLTHLASWRDREHAADYTVILSNQPLIESMEICGLYRREVYGYTPSSYSSINSFRLNQQILGGPGNLDDIRWTSKW